ncbi:F-type H+-transporting ATPase subunit a [Flavobacterium sp. CG_23.5]|uniref:F0F1 ATP synthase subunit A n=1 Tax=unclassified Flavobacterium TaxID=196869 RepID=UPI0018C99029|nr:MULTISPECIES: F0F1 ATP synthase subunit A [unclassified Flavobacterium]MBG6111738.1 F-type H+-transporting ATPase subunit a [Flavobacterium sp. CG_9.10]MBP2283661.1 F-type H+-transporting ATPase subunit a [Flavobacterium sp. CG_23.5]
MVISNKPLRFIIATLVACLPLISFANPQVDSVKVQTEVALSATEKSQEEAHAEPTDVKSKIRAFIGHHVLDSHDFTFFSDEVEGKHYGFSLPVILWDNGLQFFSSSKFEHGEAVAESNGNFYKINHHDGKIYKTDASGTITENEETGHPTNVRPIDFSITKTVFSILLASLIMFLLFTGLAKSYSKNKGIASGVGRIFEPVVLYIRDEIAIPNIGEKHYKKYMSYLLTIFFFVLFLNIFGLMPFGINVTGNLTVTFALAILTFLITNLTANKNYWGHIFWMPGVPKAMRIILAPIELLGIFIKPFSLMIRLYANIFAGHIVLMSIIGLMFIFKSWLGSSLSFGLSFVLSILEILVAFLQAYIFTMLSALYFGSAVEEHHHEEAH